VLEVLVAVTMMWDAMPHILEQLPASIFWVAGLISVGAYPKRQFFPS
jgi:hypothetical protein